MKDSPEWVEAPEEWGILSDEGEGEPDEAADARLSAFARTALEAIRGARGDERAVRGTLAVFHRGWEAVCEQNGSASDTEVRENVYEFFESLTDAAGFEGRASRWWSEAREGCLDTTVDELGSRLEGIAARSGIPRDTLASSFETLVARVREELTTSGEAMIPGLGTLRKRSRGPGGVVVVMYPWASGEELDEGAPPRPPVEPCVSALLEDIRQRGPVHLSGIGIIGRRVYPAYEGRNPRTGAVVHVPEKSVFTCLADEELERFLDNRLAPA
ncbi:HU family DNA-binding protein [Archangium sp. Cb G35]|uniref:HU family DNA-binding protein n=1 Tax=Archangium sp. Cb G35 TaxID=1920190 RepID=UPI001160EA5A|nr:HU family DNA-binding protein [Archangium sp. Cb G35]